MNIKRSARTRITSNYYQLLERKISWIEKGEYEMEF